MKWSEMLTRVSAVAALMVVVCFFLPWVRVESRVQSQFNKLLGSKETINLITASGFDIPRLANRQDAKTAEHILVLIDPDIRNARLKSRLVWLLPGMAVAMAFLAGTAAKKKWLSLGMAAVGLGVFSAIIIKLLGANLQGLMAIVHITIWFKLIAIAYLVIGLINLLLFIQLHSGRKLESFMGHAAKPESSQLAK